ncbi:MAG: thioredoxin family protein [Rhodospirillaceae bacterium TMED8]|nr:thioredoxin family protein [Magnetovibrio sp.]OUT50819.1 MAG: thioredoxin family protein [Rhodospirillaceae bacterium TMED8]|tara:strand:+ start:74 stop:634 length:561 start_codon:yes stop_codon:yes gene_type:complete
MLYSTPICEFGRVAPAFNLPSVDGKHYSISDIRAPYGFVIMFICNHCPYVKAILERLVTDAKVLQANGIGVAAIMSNDISYNAEDSFENMRMIAKKYTFTFPYLIDESQNVARAYGAVCTPDFFGFNTNLGLQYRGRIDGYGLDPAPPSARRELVEAMMQVAKTGEGPSGQIASMGCSIKWRGQQS